jgi:molecular chaperone GrpE
MKNENNIPETEETMAADLEIMRAKLQESEEALAKAQAEGEEQKQLYMRTLADFQNFRRRQQEEMQKSRQLLLEDFVIQLLPILDNFGRALTAVEAAHDFDTLVEGIRLTGRQVEGLLERFEIKPIIAVGQPFDPNLHEAVQRIESLDYEEGAVVEEVERGYLMGERVIRPSRVIVAQIPKTGGIDATI